MSERNLEIHHFTNFFKHSVFTLNTENVIEMQVENQIHVSAGMELVVIDRLGLN